MRLIKNGGAILLLTVIGVAAIIGMTVYDYLFTAQPHCYTAEEIAAMDIQLININTATVDELTALPNIGAVLAQRIVEYRIAYGGFTSTEDIMKVNGVGEKTYSLIRLYITV